VKYHGTPASEIISNFPAKFPGQHAVNFSMGRLWKFWLRHCRNQRRERSTDIESNKKVKSCTKEVEREICEVHISEEREYEVGEIMADTAEACLISKI
jgi:hypothetical protein